MSILCYVRWCTLTASYSVLGLYISVILVIGQFLRMHTSGMVSSIMFDDLPNVDKILNLCLDIYLVREGECWDLEEDLFEKLNFLYRSPELLIKWSRDYEKIPKDDMPALSLSPEKLVWYLQTTL